MIKNNKWEIIFLSVGIIIYLLSPGPQKLLGNPTPWELREQMIFLSGTIAASLMVLTVLTSIRLTWLNKQMGGLDKAYKIHKSAAIYCVVLSVLHWLMEKIPGWLVKAGAIAHPGKLGDSSVFTSAELFLWHSGVTIVEYLMYVLIIFVVVALSKKVPYKYFRWSHKVFPIMCILFFYHSATVQLKDHWLTTPSGYLLLVLMAIGVLASVIGLLQMIGFNKKVQSRIVSINKHGDVLEVTLKTDKKFIYRPGQYAFLSFDHNKEPHPFTIASSGLDPHNHTFSIKQFGDFTRDLPSKAQLQQKVVLEGPYGEFMFDDDQGEQLWVATGIGITPFMAKMAQMKQCQSPIKPTRLIYCGRGPLENQYPGNLQQLCQESGVQLQYIDTRQDGKITTDSFIDLAGRLDDASVWFCGNTQLLAVIRSALGTMGVNPRNLHFDSFDMR